MTKEVTNGSDLMLFVKGSGDTYTSIAYATSCSVELSAETSETTSKDHTGGWSTSVVRRLSWTASSENLYADGLANGYDLMYDAIINKTPIEIYFCVKTGDAMTGDSWTQGTGGYKGKVLITSLSATAPDGENATFSVSMTGYGSLDKVTESDDDDEDLPEVQ